MNVDLSTSVVVNRSRELLSRYAANPYTYEVVDLVPGERMASVA